MSSEIRSSRVQNKYLDYGTNYLAMGFKLVVLTPSTEERCSCGDPLCELPGSHPRSEEDKAWPIENEDELRAHFETSHSRV